MFPRPFAFERGGGEPQAGQNRSALHFHDDRIGKILKRNEWVYKKLAFFDQIGRYFLFTNSVHSVQNRAMFLWTRHVPSSVRKHLIAVCKCSHSWLWLNI